MNQRVAIILMFILGTSFTQLWGQCPPVSAYDFDESPVISSPAWAVNNDEDNPIIVNCLSEIDPILFDGMHPTGSFFFGVDKDNGIFNSNPVDMCSIIPATLPGCGTSIALSFEVEIIASDDDGFRSDPGMMFDIHFVLNDTEAPTFDPIPNVTISTLPPVSHACPSSSGATTIGNLMVGGGPYSPNHNFTVGGTTVMGPSSSLYGDNCNSSLDLDVTAISHMMMPNSCNEVVMIEWEVTDRCGSTATSIQNITVSDQTPPVWSNNPTDVTILNSTGCADCPSSFLSIPQFDLITSFPSTFGFNADLTIACQTHKSPLEADFSDFCNSVSLEVLSVAYGGNASSKTATVVWSAIDACGNRANRTQVFRLTDDVAPIITTSTIPLDFNCSGTIPTPVITENCQNIPTTIINTTPNANVAGIYYSDDITHSMMCDYISKVERTWQASDGAGNLSNIWVQTINFNDDTAPTFDLPTNITITDGLECADDPLGTFFPTYLESQVIESGFPTNIEDFCQPDEATSTSNYDGTNMWETDGDYSIKFSDFIVCPHPDGCTPTAGNLPKFRIERTWEITDDCGNTSTQTQYIDISDNTAPTISGDTNLGTLNLSAANGACPNDADFLLFSNTSSASTFYYNGTDLIVRDPVTNAVLQTFTSSTTQTVPVATDECANSPFLMCNNTATLNLENVVVIDNSNAPCLVTYQITWNATDHCGNTNAGADRHFQSITFRDNSAPAWNFTAGDLDEIIDCNDSTEPSGGDVSVPVMANISDNCGVTISYTQVTNPPTATSASGLYYIDVFAGSCTTGNQTLTRTWYAVDACGNVTAAFVQTINIQDTTGPTFTSVPPNDATLKCIPDSTYYLYLLAAVDDCLTTPVDLVMVEDVNTTPLATGCGTEPIIIERTYTVSDVCGNTNTTSHTLVILDDEAPVVLSAPDTITVCPDNIPAVDTSLISAEDGSNCNSTVTITFISETKTPNTTGCTRTPRYTNRIYHVADMCGNVTPVHHVIKEIDENVPTVVRLPQDTTVECDGSDHMVDRFLWAQSGGGGIVADDCGSPEIVGHFSPSGSKGAFKCQECFPYEFWAKDGCGDIDSIYIGLASFCIEDTTFPVFDVLAADTTVQCDGSGNLSDLTTWLGNNGGAAATETCSELIWSYQPLDSVENCGLTRSIQYQFTAEDSCGNKILTTADFNIIDDVAPLWNTVPPDTMVTCDGVGNPVQLNAWLTKWTSNIHLTEACGIDSVRYELTAVIDPNPCNGSLRQFYEFIAVDDCGNTTTHAAEFFINDTTAPTLSCPSNVTIYCTESASFSFTGLATATDACSGTIIPTFMDDVSAPGCTQTITRTWTAMDDCGNSMSCDQIIMVSDTLLPQVLNDANDLTVECDGAGNTTELNAWLADNAGAVASDDCGTLEYSKYEITPFPTGNFECNKCVEYAFWAKDGCNVDSISLDTVKFCIEDTTLPTFSMLASDTTVQCDGSGNTADLASWLGNHGGAMAAETCSEIIWNEVVVNTIGNCGLTQTITYEFTAEDSCGNKILTTADFQIIDDVAPLWNTVPPDTMVTCDGLGNPVQLNAWLTKWTSNSHLSDQCGIDSVRYELTAVIDPNPCHGSLRQFYEFTAVDDCGNTTTHAAEFFINDTTAPTLSCPSNVTIYCTESASFSFTGLATATDACSGTIIPTFMDDVSAPGCTQTITRTWTAMDDCGNSMSCDQIIMVSDTLLPQVLNDANGLTVECDGAGNTTELNAWLADNAGAVASDDCGTLEYSKYEITPFPTGNFECNKCVEYAFWAKDGCNVDSISLDTVKFCIEDTTLPTFSMLASDTTVQCDGSGNTADLASWLGNHGGAMAAETCSEIIWNEVVVNTIGNCGLTQTITYEFTAEDSCGNKILTTADFQIIDDVAPLWNTVPPDTMVTCDGLGNPVQLNAWLTKWTSNSHLSDQCGIDSVRYELTAVIDPNPCHGSLRQFYEFTAVDDCGNTTTHAAEFFINDTTAPTLSCPPDVTIDCSESASFSFTGLATATDICSGTIIPTFTDVNMTVGCEEGITRTWTAVDDCGNSTTCDQTIMVRDTILPVVLNLAENMTVECDGSGNTAELNAWLADNAGAVADDDCGTLEFLKYETSPFPAGNFQCEKCTEYEFWAKDGCLPDSTFLGAATFCIEDSTPPLFDTLAINKVVDCDGSGNVMALNAWLADRAGARATENCTELIWDHELVNTQNTCGGSIATYQFFAKDSCDFEIVTSASFIIEDDLAPDWLFEPVDTLVYCDGTNNQAALNAWLTKWSDGSNVEDLCGGETISYSLITTVNPDPCFGQLTSNYRFVAEDDCGNKAIQEVSFSVLDTLPPTITCPADIVVDCTDDYSPSFTGSASGSDACSFSNSAGFRDSVVLKPCPNVENVYRIWSVSDACGNSNSCMQLIERRDTEPPFISNAPLTQFQIDITDAFGGCHKNIRFDRVNMSTQNCWEVFFDVNDVDGNSLGQLGFPGPCVMDDCSDLIPRATVVPVTRDQCLYNFDVNWFFSDSCMNSVSFTQNITIEDKVAPQWTSPNPLIVNGKCSDDINLLIANNIPTVEDNCGGIITEVGQTTSSANCTEVRIVEYETMDSCGNVNPVKLQVRVEISDDLAPVWVTNPRDTFFECDGMGNLFDLNDWLVRSSALTNVTDDCGTPNISFTQVATINPDTCFGQVEYIYEFIAADGCGNSTSKIGIFHILDNAAPIITCPPTAEIDCGQSAFPFLTGSATANDVCSFIGFPIFTDNSVAGICPWTN